jgi:hypothetical protein
MRTARYGYGCASKYEADYLLGGVTHVMSYQITWSEGTKERLRSGVRREWLIDRIVEHVEKEIASYPQDATAQPGQRVSGELHVANCDVCYEIQMDTHIAIITGVESHAKKTAS